MKSYRFKDYTQPLELMVDDDPQPVGAEVVVRISGCGVCHSDLHIWDGHFDMGGGNKADITHGRKLPFTLGHEIVGVVVAMGPEATGCSIGQKSVVYPWIGCGDCEVCAAGNEHFCAKGRQLGVQVDGGYSDHVKIPHSRYLFPFGNADPALASTYACSGLTAFSALNKVKAKAEGGSVLIIGAGGVGMAGVMMAQAMMDTTIIVADIDEEKLAKAKEYGAHHLVDSTDPDARKQVMALSGGGIKAVVDFVGSDKSVGFGMSVLAAQGCLVIVGLFGGALSVSTALFPLKGITVMGSLVGSLQEMADLMELVRAGKVKPLPYTSRPLEEADRSLRDLRDGKIIGRVVLQAQ
ncbi:MAG: alcohol dehydrogenase catalytic domain-containing protein [Alphaproteobacteria bacterium]|jgi:D-arabinose 1-dehydrogenase-like Zn-dependent alcohol dehydrogenase|nr:alcohol dehydrogenase catalytic domain-containing protein [Alphaproteobacteria bacterium]MBT4082569.1 alcohol dehydrogenase catalytic domain-containing protein [Alphaproteobacteria bacterium]MBT4964656.1 alcohol dehydrogenase catalytic domain-containing protein [Alphaproteobacteria bacterium]